MADKIVIDATNATLGRLASFSAKQALLGKEITIVNCKDIIVTGRRAAILSDYREARTRGGSSRKGPHFPKIAERIVKRTIRGMLSYKQGRGLAAFKRIKCHDSVPQEYAEAKKITSGKPKKIKSIKLSEISNLI